MKAHHHRRVLILAMGLVHTSVWAELTPLKVPVLSGNKYVGASVIEDSIDNTQDKFRDRIYFYDLALESSGRAFVVYAKPKPKTPNSTAPFQPDERTDIILAIENGDTWDKTMLTTEGVYRPSGIQIDSDSNDVMHITYIKKVVKDIGGLGEHDYLIYRKHTPAGGLSEEIEVGDIEAQNFSGLGGWRTRLEIAPDNQVYMIREYENELRLLSPEGDNWKAESIVLLPINWSRLAEFHIDAGGRPHIVYGDYAFDANGNLYKTNGNAAIVDHNGYHNLWYAYSETLTGSGWQGMILDEAPAPSDPLPSLYNWQFWVDLTTDENNNPAIAKWIWNPGTPSPQAYNTYTFFFRKKTNQDWQIARTTRSFDPLMYKGISQVPGKAVDAVAGMGPGIIKDQSGWHGVWDNSHPRPFEHVSDRGGILYRFSPDGANWTYYQRLAPFSAEGRCEVQIQDGKLNILILGDHTDTQLYLLRYQLPSNNLMEVFPDRETYYQGESISLHALVREGGFVGDWYVLAISQPRPDIGEPTGDIWSLSYDNNNFRWSKVNSLNTLKPMFSNMPGLNFLDKLMDIPPLTAPFDKPREYDLYSVVSEPNVDPLQGKWVTPFFQRHILANWPLP
jgi:hypothetical protein